MFDLKTLLFVGFFALFLAVALWPTEDLTGSRSVVDEPVVREVSNVRSVKVSASSLVLRLTEAAERIYVPSTFTVNQTDEKLKISGSTGTVVVGGKNLRVDVSSALTEISGVFQMDSLTVSSTIVEFRDLVVRNGGRISVSATSVGGKIHAVGLKQELILSISATLHDLTVVVDRDSKELVKFVGIAPKVVIAD
ncbi:hypothetical protein [Fervidobacterium thailandense]|uniref:Uncharacterized protein n=1 Tax=Fervidobacterium thailandense TaxID=1008305 RepID=A0A1E3G3J1_9BACT|nr:hypothetical protein [Fervidobacterium thailandense]ODN30740.1 hypothetical protein A4H02_04215 [Fervidobacterium thailandense]